MSNLEMDLMDCIEEYCFQIKNVHKIVFLFLLEIHIEFILHLGTIHCEGGREMRLYAVYSTATLPQTWLAPDQPFLMQISLDNLYKLCIQ